MGWRVQHTNVILLHLDFTENPTLYLVCHYLSNIEAEYWSFHVGKRCQYKASMMNLENLKMCEYFNEAAQRDLPSD